MIARHSGLGFFVYALALASVCGVVNPVVSGRSSVPVAAKVTEAAFGVMPDGTPVKLFTLTNAAGMEVRAITYGIILVSIKVPDRQGRLDDIVIGHENLDGYLTKSRYFGAVVGRYGNRIAGGHVVIDGQTYNLTLNNGPNHLHGGVKGFDKTVWSAEVVNDPRGASVVFTHTSPDGHEGYPGTLAARVAYTVTDTNELIVEYLGDHRQADHRQPHAAQLLQPGRRRIRRRPRSSPDPARGSLHAGRREPDSHGRARDRSRARRSTSAGRRRSASASTPTIRSSS